ncbi:hypothetical protein PCASD_25506 [Puccinia coronata f. sp. avenae]|uniref:Uncharacterized protein n=2 Tax=Puccinia coronata f. sp. avenae TaxID=200324 RepID=A0A2N5RW63_9BASI|nr:hypothetical protein PCASD_25506 [Puccinia coronata f. sp. avenae]
MFLPSASMVMTTLLLNNLGAPSTLGAVPPPGFAQIMTTQGAPEQSQANMQVPAMMNSTAMPMNATVMAGNSTDSSQMGGSVLPGFPSIFPPKSGGGNSGPKLPSFPIPISNPTPSVNQSCVAGIKSLMTSINESEGRPIPRERVSCFKPYTKVPDAESLVVASVDAATNVTASISQLVQDVSGKRITAAIPIIISDLRTLTAVVATGVAHIALASAKGIFTSSSIVYVLQGFVTASQSVTDALIGEKGFFAQFQVLTPIRNTLLSLKSVVDKFVLLLIHMIPTNKLTMAAQLHQQMDNSMSNAISAFEEA